MAPKRPVAIDLFCGVGGMSLGFKQAGFRVVGAFDSERRHVHAYKRNFPSASVHELDLRTATREDLFALADISSDQIDMVFGGPPCQGFSVGGTRALDDERNLLLYDFARLVRAIRPKYFVLENVQGLLIGHARAAADSFVRRVRLAGYRVVEDIQVLNAADYGVPQRRKRTFILGYQSGLPAIAVNTGRTGELVRSYNLGLTFTPEDPYSLRQALLSFLSLSDEERAAMKNRVSEFASSVPLWEQMTKGYLDLYQALLRRVKYET